MKVSSLCTVCGGVARPAESCRLCGAVCCRWCYDQAMGTCRHCVKGKLGL